MKKVNLEFKVGLLLLFIAIAIGAGMIFWAKTNKTGKDTYELKTYFNFAGGIKANSVVALSGIEVGKVDQVNFIYDDKGTKVEIVMSVDKKAKVRTDSIAFVGTAGFIGDTFIGLTPGSAGSAFCESGEIITSEDPIQMKELMKKADAIASKLDDTLVDVKNLAANLNQVVAENKEKVSSILKNVDGAVADNRTRLDSIMKNLESTTVNFNEFSAEIKAHPWKLLMKGKE